MSPKPTAARHRVIKVASEIVRGRKPKRQSALSFNYQRARFKLGLAGDNRRGVPKCFSSTTKMVWRFESFEDNYKYIWQEYLRLTSIGNNKARTMLRLVCDTFDIAQVDMLSATRDMTIVMPRMIGLAMLRKDGVSFGHMAMIWKKDPKSCRYAFDSMQTYVEKLSERDNRGGHPSVGEPEGRLPAQIPKVAAQVRASDEARPDSADGRPDRSERPASRHPREQGS